MDCITAFVTLVNFALLLVMFLGPPVVLGILYLSERRQTQHVKRLWGRDFGDAHKNITFIFKWAVK
jgi:hypothetical protein